MKFAPFFGRVVSLRDCHLLRVEDHSCVMERAVDELPVGGEAGIVPIEDVIASQSLRTAASTAAF